MVRSACQHTVACMLWFDNIMLTDILQDSRTLNALLISVSLFDILPWQSDIQCPQMSNMGTGLHPSSSKKPFAFELFFCSANASFFTFSSNTSSIFPTSNLCQIVQRSKNLLNQQLSAMCIRYLERTDKNTSIYITNQR